MHTKGSLIKDMEKAGINKKGTILVHSSMKAIGHVEGGADTVLDAFIDYMKDGLLLFPTHTWSKENMLDGIYNPKTEPACVGLLPNLFMKREGAIRSMHPTHSVTAMGNRAREYVARDNDVNTPCPEHGCFGGLYDEDAQILLLGVSFIRNTYIHVIEEKFDIPNRIAAKPRRLKLVQEDGSFKKVDHYYHYSTLGSVSLNYDKLRSPLMDMGIVKEVKIGDATSYLMKVRPMADWVSKLLEEDPDLFSDDNPLKLQLAKRVVN
ncbi:MAG: AAC(3) family N-acetyltransferase [Clostridiales bacterium]|nr:AAC(3) family N-acetyltransferase [Clostridiales bacterium]